MVAWWYANLGLCVALLQQVPNSDITVALYHPDGLAEKFWKDPLAW